jgi:hypothetical protein
VIADLVACRPHGAGDFGETIDVVAALEKSGRYAVLGKDIEDFGSRFAGTVVEGEGDGGEMAGASPYGASEDLRGASADRPRHERGGRSGSGKWGESGHEV